MSKLILDMPTSTETFIVAFNIMIAVLEQMAQYQSLYTAVLSLLLLIKCSSCGKPITDHDLVHACKTESYIYVAC